MGFEGAVPNPELGLGSPPPSAQRSGEPGASVAGSFKNGERWSGEREGVCLPFAVWEIDICLIVCRKNAVPAFIVIAMTVTMTMITREKSTRSGSLVKF